MRHYSVKDGLPSSEVYGVVQDLRGYVWFATDAGISRFDGYTFRNFSTDEGLPDNAVFGLTLDRAGRVWFYTWTGNIGYISNDSVQQVPASILLRKRKKSLEVVSSMYIDETDKLWIGTLNGGGFITVTPPYDVSDVNVISPAGSGLYLSVINSKGLIYGSMPDSAASVINAGRLFIYDNEKQEKEIELEAANTATRFFLAGDKEICIAAQDKCCMLKNGAASPCVPHEGRIIYIYTDSNGNTWHCMHKNGARLFSRDKDVLLPPKILQGLSVTRVLEDREHGYWITTLEDGVYYLPSLSFLKFDERNGLPENKILRVRCYGRDSLAAETSSGNICLIENGKINYFDLSSGAITFGSGKNIMYPHNFVPLSSNSSSWFYFYKDKYLKAIQSKNGSPALKSFVRAPDGALYGIVNYLFRIDERSVSGEPTRNLPDRILTVHRDKKNNVWLGGLMGLWKWENDQVIYMGDKDSLFRHRIVDIAESAAGTLVFATRGAGVIVLDNGRTINYRARHGLASNLCKAVIADSSGNFWIGTNKGLSRFSYGRGEFGFENFSTNEGLISDEVNRLSLYGDILWVATNAGIARLDVNDAFVNKTRPLIYITDYSVNSVRQEKTAGRKFEHFENYFVINFTGIYFHDFGHVKYKYRLEGLDTAWHYTYNNSIQYTPLQPGNYVFKVYALNRNGLQSVKPAILEFSIAKPFWKQVWFILALSSTVVAIIYISFRQRTRKIRQKEVEKTAFNKKIAETELKALRAQMNPHFIFNAINSIQNFILKNDQENAHRYLTRFSKLIRNVLENSEQEEITIQQEIETLELYLQIEALRFAFQFNYRILVDENLNKMLKIPAMIIQPYLENAIWHGLMHKEGERNLTLEIRKENDHFIHCIVDDDGIGRAKAAGLKTTGKSLYSSMGMQITRDRLEILNKQYGLHSSVIITDKTDNRNQPAGTKVEIYIPVKY